MIHFTSVELGKNTRFECLVNIIEEDGYGN